MVSFKSIVLIAATISVGAECSAVPAVAAAPLVNAHVGYAHAVPQNIPPYASQVSVVNRALSPLVAPAPAIAAPLATPFAAPLAAPLAAPYASPLAAPVAPFAPVAPAPYFAGPAPVLPAVPSAYAAAPFPYAAPYPYAAPLLRSPFGLAPTFVR